jgi:hypothetical protein
VRQAEKPRRGFDWLKKVIEQSSLAGRIRYRDNDPEEVDVRTALFKSV